ncbi:hypothetical protein B0H15DRAFT_380155 [Mycena belliarum]|uniref:Uncharacterized protein n=1 Tax=Mycena belliarum TaxID=1033014 RepID=A0AAD6U5G4_9AGAR|nr:hypothetical protein B0H15DRAFT_380155 [Mycena belliae]
MHQFLLLGHSPRDDVSPSRDSRASRLDSFFSSGRFAPCCPDSSETTYRRPASGGLSTLFVLLYALSDVLTSSSLNFFSFRRFAPPLTITLGHLGRLADSIFRRPANGIQPIWFVHHYCCPRASRPNALTRYMGVRRGGFQLSQCVRAQHPTSGLLCSSDALLARFSVPLTRALPPEKRVFFRFGA